MVYIDIQMCVCGNGFSIWFFYRIKIEAYLSVHDGSLCCQPRGWQTTAWHNEKPSHGRAYPPWNYHRYQKWWVGKCIAILGIYVRFQGANSKPCPTLKRPGLNKSLIMDRKEPHSRWTRHFVVATIQGSPIDVDEPSNPQHRLITKAIKLRHRQRLWNILLPCGKKLKFLTRKRLPFWVNKEGWGSEHLAC